MECISKKRVESNKPISQMLQRRGIKPEELPTAEDIQKAKRKLDGDGKGVLKEEKPSGKK